MRLSGADGSTVGETAVNGTEGPDATDYGYGIVLDGLGDPVVTGVLDNEGSEYDAAVVKLAAGTGAEIWRRLVKGEGEGFDVAVEVAIDSAGDVVVAATLEDSSRTVAAKLNADGSSDPVLADGRSLVMIDVAGDPATRKLKLAGAGDGVGPADLSSLANPTVNGGELLVRNPSSGETMTLALPAAGWVARGRKGYVYADRTLALGPCRQVKVRARSIKASCRGSGLSFTLDEPAQGALEVRVRQGGVHLPIDAAVRGGVE